VILPVYLVHWNAHEWCASAVRSVLASDGIAVDVTVVDNGTANGTSLAAALPPTVRVLQSGGNVGYAGAANLALSDWRTRFPEGELCVIGSHDLHVERTTLARLADDAARNPVFGVVSPVLTAPHRCAGGIWNGRHSYQVSPPPGTRLVTRDWTSGTCLLVRRACVDDIGGFDERFGSYVEDVDFGLRANARGWAVVVDPSASAHGVGTVSTDSIARIAANTVRLGYKQRGVVGALDTTALFVAWIAKGYVASVWPWRDAAHRRVSRDYATQRTVGLYRLARATCAPLLGGASTR
jgi:GT2 family glycosyltransferase